MSHREATISPAPIVRNAQVITGDMLIPSGQNALLVGPISIASGVTITVQGTAVLNIY